ncbi:hypothetical protein C2845_PM13G18110 [Panicum miliaceum]|uniref:DUF7597 domain-containing protein n=1 Tax=Panicum miliaceum TaxID=4540 RepID=A0A3L6RHZ2_PANMI|nr:hypothetical protein C2845_PM13G18110 [Panicum miliaceum]
MALQRVDPTPFLPRGMQWQQVQNRAPVVRAVATRPRRRNEDLAIFTIEPFSGNLVSFQNIREVVHEFIVDHLRIEIVDIQPCHLGQAYVRFSFFHDCDNLIRNSPHVFDDVSISFVKHNRGKNWRSVQFNRECWLMLMGFPVDYWEREYIDNAICTLGKVLSWEQDMTKLSRLIVKARVLDLESMPQFIILSDAEGFHGESWTIQCEVLSDELLGGQPQDEDPLPLDPLNPVAPFDFFGHGQIGAGPIDEAEQNVANMAPQNQAAAEREPWPELQIAQPNNQAQNQPNQTINLNAVPMDQDLPAENVNGGEVLNPGLEMAVDEGPIQGDAHIKMHDLVPNVIEEEVDQHLIEPPQLLEEPVPPLVVLGLQAHAPENWLVEKLPEDMLMGDDELNAVNDDEDELQQPQQQPPHNIQLGMVEILEEHRCDPSFAGHQAKHSPLIQNAEAVRLWAIHFKDSSSTNCSVNIPEDWCNFFTSLLLSPTHFSWVSNFLQSKAWYFFSSDKGKVLFSIPPKCSVNSEPLCNSGNHLFTTNANTKGKAVIEELTPPSSPPTNAQSTQGECSMKGVEKKRRSNCGHMCQKEPEGEENKEGIQNGCLPSQKLSGL